MICFLMTIATLLPTAPTHDELSYCIRTARAPRLRSLRQFAEAEMVIPEGKYRGMKLRIHRQPYVGLLFDAIDSGRWSRRAILGCVQSGKTFCGFVAPLLYHLFEHRETVICGIPTGDMAGDKWSEEILPAIESSGYRRCLPSRGPGSRGGTVKDRVKFTHGPTLRFMSGHGGDEKRSAFTARVVVITEADKMDEAGEASREADPVSQLEARSSSYDEPERVLSLECTTSIESGRIWREYQAGTTSRIACPCPHCGEYVTPEREHLIGWERATNKIEAGRLGRFVCPACGAAIDDAQRAEMNRRAVLVHRGQSIGRDGVIHGDPPETDTLGFRWNAFNNLFWSTSTIAAGEWDAAEKPEGPERENAEKQQCQFVWAVPYLPPDIEHVELKPGDVRRRTGALEQNLVPADTEHLVVGTDVGKWHFWYLVLAAGPSGLHVPDYGVTEVHSDDLPESNAIVQALREFRRRAEDGWPIAGRSDRRVPDRVWIDSGYMPDAVFQFIRESGTLRANRYMGIVGRGLSQIRRMERGNYTAPAKTDKWVRRIGDGWHLTLVPKYRAAQITINADQYKLACQHGFALPAGQPGAITLFDPGLDRKRHTKLEHHLLSEKLVHRVVPGRGEIDVWEKHGANHWLDCACYALCALNFCGFRLLETQAAAAAAPLQRPAARLVTPDGQPYLVTERS